MPDEVEELGAGDAVQHLRRQVADDERRTHEIGGETDHQNEGEYGGSFERARERQRHRRHHEDRHDVVDEHRDDAGQNRQDHDEQAGAPPESLSACTESQLGTPDLPK